MPIKVVCSCGRQLMVPDHRAGRAVQCPKCNQRVEVPGERAADPVPTAPPAAAAEPSPPPPLVAKPAAPPPQPIATSKTNPPQKEAKKSALPLEQRKPKAPSPPVAARKPEPKAPAPAPPPKPTPPSAPPVPPKPSQSIVVAPPPPPVASPAPPPPIVPEPPPIVEVSAPEPPASKPPPAEPIAPPPPPESVPIAPPASELPPPAPPTMVTPPPLPAPSAISTASIAALLPTDPIISTRVGYHPDPEKIAAAYVLSMVVVTLAVFSMVPGLIEVVRYLRDVESYPVGRWAFVVFFLGSLQLAYAFYLGQLPDWSSSWVLTAMTLLQGAVYAALLTALQLAGGQSSIVMALDLGPFVDNGQARAWCFVMLCLSGMAAYFCGRVSMRWRRAFVLVRDAHRHEVDTY